MNTETHEMDSLVTAECGDELAALGIRADGAVPYSVQSKPIEHAFRDFAGDVVALFGDVPAEVWGDGVQEFRDMCRAARGDEA